MMKTIFGLCGDPEAGDFANEGRAAASQKKIAAAGNIVATEAHWWEFVFIIYRLFIDCVLFTVCGLFIDYACVSRGGSLGVSSA